jgi:hypothetical protein
MSAELETLISGLPPALFPVLPPQELGPTSTCDTGLRNRLASVQKRMKSAFTSYRVLNPGMKRPA